ncbi:hypothetical protein INR49_018238 [Caranx melampygus]|nr:hypothetical protein INR49_018238 [Caranx melampygus]
MCFRSGRHQHVSPFSQRVQYSVVMVIMQGFVIISLLQERFTGSRFSVTEAARGAVNKILPSDGNHKVYLSCSSVCQIFSFFFFINVCKKIFFCGLFLLLLKFSTTIRASHWWVDFQLFECSWEQVNHRYLRPAPLFGFTVDCCNRIKPLPPSVCMLCSRTYESVDVRVPAAWCCERAS